MAFRHFTDVSVQFSAGHIVPVSRLHKEQKRTESEQIVPSRIQHDRVRTESKQKGTWSKLSQSKEN